MLALPGLALLDRRDLLAHLASGLGAIALADLLARDAAAAPPWRPAPGRAHPPPRPPRPPPAAPPAPAPAALQGEGEARRPRLLLRGVQPPRHLRLQTGAAEARRPAAARREGAGHLPGGQRQPGAEPVPLPAARPVRQVDLRPPAAGGGVRR